MLTELQRTIAAAVSDGCELDAIEEQIINQAPLDEEDKSVLWLYAEALTQQRARRPLAGATFGEPRRPFGPRPGPGLFQRPGSQLAGRTSGRSTTR